jgi:hypothetical protein
MQIEADLPVKSTEEKNKKTAANNSEFTKARVGFWS